VHWSGLPFYRAIFKDGSTVDELSLLAAARGARRDRLDMVRIALHRHGGTRGAGW
jgi:hypothetical protein